ncbi:hypothetical protein PPSIR1_38284 [Plesiocystis pacifica SIR-1]|uniref:Uncharacterized protein n=1 Tax=Plesiocystis pacifica SIR-1 TaxID=391625 RepID=A6GBT6_9BACT|nr:hypothetical protein PPSIR1_38284 [Plesiocystis pacifica SIR-1]
MTEVEEVDATGVLVLAVKGVANGEVRLTITGATQEHDQLSLSLIDEQSIDLLEVDLAPFKALLVPLRGDVRRHGGLRWARTLDNNAGLGLDATDADRCRGLFLVAWHTDPTQLYQH